MIKVLNLFFVLILLTQSSTYSQKRLDNAGYLFVYFTGNGPGEEAIRFALSSDGYNFRAINGNEPILDSKVISTTGGVRDPHILRGEKDSIFYMVATDLYVPICGWSNTAMVMLKSKDLINWTYSKVDIPANFEEYKDVRRVWAPQTIFDPKAGKYMIYFSMLQPGSYDKIYYAYANKDFTGLETSPKQLFFNPEEKACIDGDIIRKDGKYHLFFKTEGAEKGIKKAVSEELTSGYKMIDRKMDQAEVPVEGSSIFKRNNSDKYILMYDMYTSGKYQFTESTDLENFKIIDQQISMNFKPRHGTILPISTDEAKRLLTKWGKPENFGIVTANAPEIKKLNIVINQENKSMYIPVKWGTNLKKFDSQLNVLPGVEIIPAGLQDFRKRPVKYTTREVNGKSTQWSVNVIVENNPVLPGYYADPEIIYSEKNRKFYLYPTSDGFQNWSGYYFETFSSDDLVNWKNEGRILTLGKDVTWSSRNAWAPTIIEKKINGQFKYFYYFCASQKVGVAVSDKPEGSFKDSGKPLIDFKPARVKGGQEIDPDVFHDPVSNKDYLFWGNGYMAVAELNSDMISIDSATIKVITPDTTFREGTEIFYRNGRYYFLWSENDTRSPDYRVRYGYSDLPTEIKTIPAENIVIEKDTANGIYGTGHNAVIQVPGRDEWYIIYHRFTLPEGINMGRAAGYFREVCIDRLEFNHDGSIRKVIPTLNGINPIPK